MTSPPADGLGWPSIPRPRAERSAVVYPAGSEQAEAARREFLRHAAMITGADETERLPDTPAVREALRVLDYLRERDDRQRERDR